MAQERKKPQNTLILISVKPKPYQTWFLPWSGNVHPRPDSHKLSHFFVVVVYLFAYLLFLPKFEGQQGERYGYFSCRWVSSGMSVATQGC